MGVPDIVAVPRARQESLFAGLRATEDSDIIGMPGRQHVDAEPAPCQQRCLNARAVVHADQQRGWVHGDGVDRSGGHARTAAQAEVWATSSAGDAVARRTRQLVIALAIADHLRSALPQCSWFE